MELWMIGTGPLLKPSITLAKNHPSIKFEGFKNQTELKSILEHAEILLLTSQRETWGLVVNECFSMGLPAIVSDACGCCPDLIEEGHTGYSYKSNDVPGLSAKIL